ncbi:histidine kinase [Cristinia sonorae]|uniref:histidine kinase n=1 Tax=Cristinia sonorae TaxID=1940300 RepID=A0A8K0UGW8_9AGAR|nr:histidine kinase [Cristinia sonorae]
MPLRRKFNQPALPTLYFRDGILSVPGYTFDKATAWDDTGSMTLLAEGMSLKDGSNVLAKIAPAHSNASMIIEREAHILERISESPESANIALRMIDFFSIPKSNGDCIILLLAHPGLNLLARYFPASKVNPLLLADISRTRPFNSHPDIYMMGTEEPELFEEMDPMDIMDLASFLEFAIQATRCLEEMHKSGIVHREVRTNAFHLNAHSGLVRLVHFGNRAVSLEQFGVPSSFVLRADAFDESKKLKVKESLCYLAPEQTGSVEALTEDHRTDLYSLGVLFWTLLVGRGTMPFEGGPLELLHAIVQKRPMPVHEVRRDIPQVLALIIDKLLAKNPDARYQSAHGLQADLMQCQRRLLNAVTLAADESQELIPYFDIATQDRFEEFTIPSPLFGREKELETIRNIIRHTSTAYSRHMGASNGSVVDSSQTQGSTSPAGTVVTIDDRSESMSSKSDVSLSAPVMSPTTSNLGCAPVMTLSGQRNSTGLIPPPVSLSDGLRRVALGPSPRRNRTHAIVITGPPGAGKSSLVLANQAKWRSHGLWGQARFQETEAAPFASLLACLSSVLRQLIVFHTDLHRFVTALRVQLGPQLQNVPLLYEGAPELQDILGLFDISIDMPEMALDTHELRARFQSLVEGVFTVLAETRLFALFLDDLHEASDSSLDLITTLANSRSRMLIFVTVRTDKPQLIERLKTMFSARSATWINLEALSISAVSSLVARTLHRSKDDAAPLSRLIHAASQGNAFSVRKILTTLQRQRHITYNAEKNAWDFDLPAIEARLMDAHMVSDPNNLEYLVKHLRELPEDARKYLIWASFFGATFQVTEVALMMDWEDTSGSSSDEENSSGDTIGPADIGPKTKEKWSLSKAVNTIRDTGPSTSRGSMRGLQTAIQEGWLVQRGRDMCSFAHDRYRQATQSEAMKLPETVLQKMSFRIILMMLHETTPDVHRIAEYAKRCLPLLKDNSQRKVLLSLLLDAGDSARARGAHELALQSYSNAFALLDEKPWDADFGRTMELYLRLAELSTWKADFKLSESYISECLERVTDPEHKARILRLRSRNNFLRGNYSAALEDTLLGLRILGVEVNASPSRREADMMFEQVKNEVLAVGFDDILSIPRARDPRTDLAIELLNDAGTNAYWSSGEGFADIIGLTTIQMALRAGICPGTALGFFWALGAAAERRELFRFSADLGKLALRIADQYGSNFEKCRALLLFVNFISGYDNVHIRSNLPRAEDALKYGQSAGDRIYTCFSSVQIIQIKLYVCEHLSELVIAAEESLADVTLWSNGGDPTVFAQAHLNCIRALAGYTDTTSAETAFDTATFCEREYLLGIAERSGNLPVVMNWYNAFKVVGLFCLGFAPAAAELGFEVYATRDKHPNHRHIRYGLFFHSLAMITCIREENLSTAARARFLKQIDANQSYIRKWLSPSAVNNSTWVAIVDAEMASLVNSPDSFKLYDIAVKLAVNNDWLLEEGWASYLQGCHFVRCGVEGLGGELQRRGIARQAQWGARGIVNNLSARLDNRSQLSLKRHIFSSEVAVQTDSVLVSSSTSTQDSYHQSKSGTTEEDQMSSLTAADLASILKWSKEISSDINLSLALQKLTDIATEASGSQVTCVVIARDVGDYTVATSMATPEPCQVHENPVPVRAITDPLQRAVIQQALNAKERIYLEDVTSEPQFSSEAQQSPHRSVVCLPIVSNRNQTFGAIYLASKYAFSPNTVTILTLLCEQASIGIANALLFRSVQAGTRENLKMISTQRDALEAARKSREDALKATKIKSNFLASMSHELRTPFSSFYGLLDILSGTELNSGQREIVQTAKQSCELLLKIIDSILDYSKLEASALKLEFSPFAVEDIIADCMELLLPMAVKKLDLSFNIEHDVPAWVKADYARIRQVLMNLIGNAVKFTARGSVTVTCSVDRRTVCAPGEVSLKFTIQDTGIGLSATDVDQLFVPFQQADNSSTRRFGGTGLGLSISRQLVKLMGGAIGVQSEVNVGSLFWFTIPVKLHDSEESKAALSEIEKYKALLMVPSRSNVLVISQSPATISLLITMLSGLHVTSVSSIEDAERALRGSPSLPALDFVIMDSQSEYRADEMARFLHGLEGNTFTNTKLVHLYTPTTDTLTGHTSLRSETPGVIRMTKPPRRTRLLHMLAIIKHPEMHALTAPVVQAKDDGLSNRTLFGKVLIAEDNPVAQKLLIKQLERFDLQVVATSNGEEALSEWEAHEPGYFSVALFDHHMPICDGVEACKRLRVLENKRKVAPLPIVALSADCQESTKQLCLSAGMNAFLSKPLRKSDLISLLGAFGDIPPLESQTTLTAQPPADVVPLPST